MAKIDPSFQAAPVFRILSILWLLLSNRNRINLSRQQAQYEQGQKDQTEVLKDQTVQLKAWRINLVLMNFKKGTMRPNDIAMKGMKMGMNLIILKLTVDSAL